jgi:hypothetical protein
MIKITITSISYEYRYIVFVKSILLLDNLTGQNERLGLKGVLCEPCNRCRSDVGFISLTFSNVGFEYRYTI